MTNTNTILIVILIIIVLVGGFFWYSHDKAAAPAQQGSGLQVNVGGTAGNAPAPQQ